jgi:hypothetical protein
MSAASDSGGDIKNLDAVEEMYEAKKQKEQEQFRDAEEALSTEEWLESKLAEQSNAVEIYGREFEFKPMGSKTVEDVAALFGDEAESLDINADSPSDIDADDIDEEAVQDLPQTMWTLRHELGEHCLDDEMDASAFGRIPPGDLIQIFDRVAADLTQDDAERAKRFR